MTLARLKSYRFYQGTFLIQLLDGNRSKHILRNQHQPLAFIQDQQAIALACDTLDSIHHASSMSYTPFGYLAAREKASMLAFTGEWKEPTIEGYLLGNGHRAYSPVLMRFFSADSLSPFNRGGLNAYSYCGNDPINNTDPNGRMLQTRSTQPKIFSKTFSKSVKPSSVHTSVADTLVNQKEPEPPSYASALASLPKEDPGLPTPPRYSTAPLPKQLTLNINLGGVDASSPISQENAVKIANALSRHNTAVLEAVAKGPVNDDFAAFGKLLVASARVEQAVAFGRIALQHRQHITQFRQSVGSYPIT